MLSTSADINNKTKQVKQATIDIATASTSTAQYSTGGSAERSTTAENLTSASNFPTQESGESDSTMRVISTKEITASTSAEQYTANENLTLITVEPEQNGEY